MAITTNDTNSYAGGVLSGTYTGTTAAQAINIGFEPSWLIIWNQTDGDTMVFWHKSSLTSYIGVTSAAATVSAAITTSANGFNLASDAVANENAKVYVFLAGR